LQQQVWKLNLYYIHRDKFCLIYNQFTESFAMDVGLEKKHAERV